MNSFEEIINKEKQRSYPQRDKQLFSFYTLTLITQEQAAKKLNKKLRISLLVIIACLSLLLSPINQMAGYISAYLSAIDILDILIMGLISYSFTGLCIAIFKRGSILR